MLDVIYDTNGNIKAVCEWYPVSDKGEWQKDGEFVWINEVAVSKQYRNNGALKQLVKQVLPKVPKTARFGYFWRQGKYPNRKVRLYHRYFWNRLAKEDKNGSAI